MKSERGYGGVRRLERGWAAILLAICAGMAALSGCRSPQQQAVAEVKHYQLEGEVVSIDAANKQVVVNHGDISGFMDAMTMPYPVADVKELNGLAAGDRIRADIVVTNGDAVLQNITVLSKAKTQTPEGTTQHTPQKGEAVPDFRFVNQDGRAIHLGQFHGKALLITFIYTRCPLPDFCPRMNDNFAQVRAALKDKAAVKGRVQLLTLSFDAKNDTPAELRRYAARYKQQDERTANVPWDFAVPTAKELPEIAQFFGLTVLPEKDQIVHSLSTTVVGPDGKVFSWYHGNDWTAQDAATNVTAALSPVSVAPSSKP